MSNQRSRYYGLSAFWFATSLKWFILFFLLPSMVSQVVEGGEKNRWWGLIVAIGACEAMVGPAIVGWLSDRSKTKWGRRRPFIAVGAGLTAIALLVMGQAHTVPLLMAAYLLVQISDDIGTGPFSSAIPDLVHVDDRGTAAGQMGLLQLIGQVAAVAIGLGLRSSPTLIFATIAAINVVCACLSIASIARLEAVEHEVQGEQSTVPSGSFWSPLRDPDFRWAWGTRFLNALGFYIVLNYLVNYLDDVVKVFKLGPIELGSPFEGAIAMAAVLSIVGAVASVLNGRRSDIVGRKRVVREAGWIMFVPLIAFCFVRDYVLLIPLAALFGIGYGSYLSADWALVSDVLPNQSNTARDMGVWQMSIAAPQVLSGAIGYLIDKGNAWQHGDGYRIAFLIASVAMLLGSVLVQRIKGST